MKKPLVAFAAAISLGVPMLVAPPVAQARETAAAQLTEMELAREIVDRGYPAEARLAMFTAAGRTLMDQMINAIPNARSDTEIRNAIARFQQKVIEAMEDVLASGHMDAFMEAIVTAYAETFTHEELVSLHAFMMTPAGDGFLARSTEMLGHPEFAAANEAYIADYMARLPELQEEFRTDIERIVSEREENSAK